MFSTFQIFLMPRSVSFRVAQTLLELVQHPDGSQDDALEVLQLLCEPQMQQLLFEAATNIAQKAEWGGLPEQEDRLSNLQEQLSKRCYSLQLEQQEALAALQEQQRKQQQNPGRGGIFHRGFLDSRMPQQHQLHQRQRL